MFGIENVFTFVLNFFFFFFVFGLEMKVRTVFPQIWFRSTNRVGSSTGRRLGSYSRFEKYFDLISYLLVAEQNNELLLKNHQSRPNGFASIPEVNVASSNGRGRSCGHGQKNYQSREGHINTTKNHKKWFNNIARQGKEQFQPPTNYENKYYKCGMKGHWSRTCYTADHLVKLYQTLLKEKGKEKKETNLIDSDDPVDITHLDVSNFF